MPITTGSGLERNGADAIHYAISDTKKNLFFLGESKAYTSGTFRSAMEKAIASILTTHKEFSNELGLYIYDDFLEEKLQVIAEKFKDGTLKNVEVHLVLLIAYNEDTTFEMNNETQIKSDIIKTIENRCAKLEKKIFSSIDKGLHPRFNYIFFPVWELDKLIEKFQTRIGK